MKRAFLYLCTMLLVGATLSSCLGDSESSYEGQSYAVISDINGTKVALFALGQGYAISSQSLSSYNKGDIIYMSYKLDFNNTNSSGIIPADYVSVAEGDVYRDGDSNPIKETAVPEGADEYKFKALTAPRFYAPNEFFLDRWLFTYSYDRKKGEDVNGLLFYYDESNQEAAQESEDPDNTYIIDVRLNIEGKATGTETTTTEGGQNVNFGRFRGVVQPEEIASEGTVVNIWFRYYKGTETTPTISKGAVLSYFKEK